MKNGLVTLLVLTQFGCAFTERQPPEKSIPLKNPCYQAPRGKYLSREMRLYSVNFEGLGWRFMLVPREFRPLSPDSYGNLYRAGELAAAFRALPNDATVVWRDDIWNAWSYPPEPVQKQIKRSAKSAGIDLHVISSLIHIN